MVVRILKISIIFIIHMLLLIDVTQWFKMKLSFHRNRKIIEIFIIISRRRIWWSNKNGNAFTHFLNILFETCFASETVRSYAFEHFARGIKYLWLCAFRLQLYNRYRWKYYCTIARVIMQNECMIRHSGNISRYILSGEHAIANTLSSRRACACIVN